MSKEVLIAADLGASGGKMVTGSYSGNALEIEDYFNFENEPLYWNGNLYWDLNYLYKCILQGVSQYSRDRKVVSLGIDTWGATYGLLDKKGRLLEPIYHYRDLRTENTLAELYKSLSKKEIFDMTGCQPTRSYTLPQLFSYIDNQDDIIRIADKMLLLPDLISYFLSGEISTERSIAGTSGLMVPDQKVWCFDLMEKLKIPCKIMTDITDPGLIKGEILPQVGEEIGAEKMKIVSVCGHDTASAVVGIPGFGIHQVYISIGTNINMGIELTKSVVSDQAFDGGFKNAGLFGDRYIFYRDFSAFWLINELRKVWKLEGKVYDYEAIMNMAKSCESKNVYIDVDNIVFNTAEGNIKNKINSYLSATGQAVLKTDEEFVRCILESIVLKVKYCVEYLRDVMKIPVEKISGVNGGSRNHVLIQWISDALGMPVYAGMPYATLAGNIMVQLYALGEVATIDEIRQLSAESFTMKEYIPCLKAKEKWDKDLKTMIQKGVCN